MLHIYLSVPLLRYFLCYDRFFGQLISPYLRHVKRSQQYGESRVITIDRDIVVYIYEYYGVGYTNDREKAIRTPPNTYYCVITERFKFRGNFCKIMVSRRFDGVSEEIRHTRYTQNNQKRFFSIIKIRKPPSKRYLDVQKFIRTQSGSKFLESESQHR